MHKVIHVSHRLTKEDPKILITQFFLFIFVKSLTNQYIGMCSSWSFIVTRCECTNRRLNRLIIIKFQIISVAPNITIIIIIIF